MNWETLKDKWGFTHWVLSVKKADLLARLSAIEPDDRYLKRQYRRIMQRPLNLDDPKTLSEKLQWLKLYDRKPAYTRMADKRTMKEIVAREIGPDHVIPLLGSWDSPDEIPWGDLPESFVLKCNHDSGSAVVVHQAGMTAADRKRIRTRLRVLLKRNYYIHNREWPYRDIEKKIIAEAYIPSLGSSDSWEYKLTCMNGRVVLITLCRGIAHSFVNARTNDFYDRDFRPVKMKCVYENSAEPVTEKPAFMDEMVAYAEKLAAGVPYLRVDFYYHEGKILFGETTFYTWGGYTRFEPEEIDAWLGGLLELPEKQG